jgi:hypothetical protein
MANAKEELVPPALKRSTEGAVDKDSLADLLEWFLNFDQRVGIVRLPQVEELFKWKQADEREQGVEPYPFENAEARFAIGVFQALGENDNEEKLGRWMTDLLQALGESKQNNEDIATSYGLALDSSHVAEAEKLPSKNERRFYLTNCWIEALCTAEVRFLGWVYQELYGKAFQPVVPESAEG